jgi:hypothetical protein
MERIAFKKAAVALLGSLADTHPLGHQGVKANRYILKRKDGTSLEVMFQKDKDAPPNIWAEERFLSSFLGGSIPCGRSPAASLYSKIGADGKPQYGRHSALEKMPGLGLADLICVAPRNLQELGRILDQLVDG